MTAAICEDDPAQGGALLALLAQYQAARPGFELSASVFTDGSKLLAHAKASGFDLYLLDIFMPGMSGIELAHRIRENDDDAKLVFLTASSDYALEAFNVSASQYLLKPVDEAALFGALDKIIATRERDEGRFIVIPTKDRAVKVPFSAIVCVELNGRVLRVALDNGEALFSKTVRVPFAEAVAPLLSDGRFLHAHKSFVLNMAFVRELTPRSFVMQGGLEIPIPRNKYTGAKNRYFDYLSSRGIGLLGKV